MAHSRGQPTSPTEKISEAERGRNRATRGQSTYVVEQTQVKTGPFPSSLKNYIVIGLGGTFR